MKFDLDQSTIQLTKGNLISLPDAEGSIVAVLWGSVWLTQDGHRRDYELKAGESFTIRGDGLIVISAFESSAVTILQPCEGAEGSSIKHSESGDRASAYRERTGESLRYVTGEELRRFEYDAHELRAVYVASLIYKVGSAVSCAFIKLREYVVALWISNVRGEWTGPRRGLYW